jgi:hypothetical protein
VNSFKVLLRLMLLAGVWAGTLQLLWTSLTRASHYVRWGPDTVLFVFRCGSWL